jgi:thiamine biosynthesis lipoprotein
MQEATTNPPAATHAIAMLFIPSTPMSRLSITRTGLLLLALLIGSVSTAAAQNRSDSLSRFEYTQIHMGMQTRIVLYAPSDSTARQAASAAFERIAELENVMSSYRPDSELMQLSAKAGGPPVPVSRALFDVLKRTQRFARRSGGAFDATMGPYIALWRKTRETGRLPPDSALQRADSLVGWRKVHLNDDNRTVRLDTPGMTLNLGGIAKGYILDRALETLRQRGIKRALIRAGGDLVAGGPPPGKSGWKVAVANADSAHRFIRLDHGAVASSGDTEQFVEIDGKRYSHVVDPRTGLGLTNRLAVTVTAPSGTTADALATTISVLGEQRGRTLADSYRNVSAYIRHP